MLETTKNFLCDYYFDRVSEQFSTSTIKKDMAATMLTTHGAGGKFVEHVLQAEYDIKDTAGIHGYDGVTSSGRPVEMKMETIVERKLGRMNAMASFPEHRSGTEATKDTVYLKDRPYILHAGTCNKTGKCVYIMCVDTREIPAESDYFVRLAAKSPRTSFAHYKDYPECYKVLFLNQDLMIEHRSKFVTGFWDALQESYAKCIKKTLDKCMAA
jgi:hypothetical protein